MTLTRIRLIVLAAVAVCAAPVVIAAVAAADNGGRPYRLALSGANEFNGMGTPINAHGAADNGQINLTLNPGQEEVCWSVSSIVLTAGDALPHVAHIHRGAVNSAGPVVVDLFGVAPVPAPTAYPTGTTCVPAARDLIRAIMHNPSAYYVNLHNAQHPAGVMRAQLGT